MLLVVAFTSGCKKDDNKPNEEPAGTNHEELITTMTLTFRAVNPTLPIVTATFKDLDGPGGNPPTQLDVIELPANSVWDVSLTLLDETQSPAEDITAEVAEEADEHVICFSLAGVSVSIERTDSDGTHEIGLESRWTVGATEGTGSVQVMLKHQPDSKDGTCEAGETDAEVSFEIRVN